MRRLPLVIWAVTFIALSAAIGAGAGAYAYRVAFERLAEQGRADLAFAADRLTSRLMRYRELAVVLTSHPDLQGMLFGDGEGDRAAADALMREMADKTGALAIDLVGPIGQVLASSGATGQELEASAQPIARALNGALGTVHRIVRRPGSGPARLFAFAAPVYGPAGPAEGAVVVTMDVRGIEDNWPGNAPAAYFADESGTVFVSNRSELLLLRASGEGDAPLHTARRLYGNDVWLLDSGRYLPHRALHLSRNAPTIGLTAHVLLDASLAFRDALLVGAATMALFLVFGAAMLVAVLQRRALRQRLTLEAAANAQLEARVEERTRALAGANADLRHEITERKEAETALKRAQDELVRASKLTALGEMSAGISHELNQPLMAIRSFAENGEAFFERGKPERARENLGRISELARRAGRIIQNLRAFARQEQGRVSDVDLGAVVNEALDMNAQKVAIAGVTVDWAPPPAPALVRGGAVRLQQVVGNLIANAVDAMSELEAGEPRRLDIALRSDPETLRLTVADTGPGLAEPDRVFDPFYSTKAVGAAEGMGLGLSISYGLVQSLGGTLRGTNRPEGGAVFSMDLPRGGQQEAEQ